MTNETNKYHAALIERIEAAKLDNVREANLTKLQKMRDICAHSEVANMFERCNVDETRFSRAIYASEKAIRFAALIINHKDALNNVMMHAAFRTAINCYRHDAKLYYRDIEQACSASSEVSDERKHLVYKRKTHKATSTTSAQKQSSLDALKTLNIIKACDVEKDAYIVNLNEIAERLCKLFNIDTTKVAESA